LLLDGALYPAFHFGCRYLDVSERPLFGPVWDKAALVRLRNGDARADAPATVEGDVLTGRNLRFANLNESDLFSADLRFSDLRHATLERAHLQGAVLSFAQLQGADLKGAQLQGVDWLGARLQGAHLDYAQLRGADLFAAPPQGADLVGAQLQGAILDSAQLQCAILDSAQLQAAKLTIAQLQGASLVNASLQGADLSGAQLRGAGLLDASIWRATGGENGPWGAVTNIDLADMRQVNISAPLSDRERDSILASIPSGPDRDAAARRLDPLAPFDPANSLLAASDGQVLANSTQRFEAAGMAADRLITDRGVYWDKLASWLLASAPDHTHDDSAAGESIAIRLVVEFQMPDPPANLRAIACRLLAVARAGTPDLSDYVRSDLAKHTGACPH
jgi:uncharacterized protein YjbI with pentapeptide repeats